MPNDALAAIACRAVREARCLHLVYGGFARRVEVHAVGRSEAGALVMRVWQVAGGSRSSREGWKLMSLADVTGADIGVERSHAPRGGFNADDPAMGGGIICVV